MGERKGSSALGTSQQQQQQQSKGDENTKNHDYCALVRLYADPFGRVQWPIPPFDPAPHAPVSGPANSRPIESRDRKWR